MQTAIVVGRDQSTANSITTYRKQDSACGQMNASHLFSGSAGSCVARVIGALILEVIFLKGTASVAR